LIQEQLIKAAKQRNPKALEQLFQESYPVLFGYLMKATLNEDIARELTQETFLKALKNIESFKEKSKFTTWLVSIATNLHKDMLRKRKHENPKTPFDSLAFDESAEERVMEKDSFARVKSVLMNLPVEKRRIFILKHYYNYTYEEISRIENCPIGTVRSRLHDCIKKIRSEMEAETI